MLQTFAADLHIHSCLSPCGEWEMSPARIIRRAREAGLDLIAVCDHNSCENAGALQRAGRREGVTVLAGLEVCSREEVHVLALFPELDAGLALQAWVYEGLEGENRPELFGWQVVADENDEVLGENPRLLIGATRWGLAEIVRRTRGLSGLTIAAHVDRPAHGILNQLGFIPQEPAFDAVEVSWRVPRGEARSRFPAIGALPCITASDAHTLADIGRARMRLRLAAPSLEELRLALRAEDGRGLLDD
ncbi:MAG: PHP domain-containing protein [Desulfobacterales bacterium]